MGLFDRFKKRVKEVVDDTDADALSADVDSSEGRAALEAAPRPDEDWEDLDALEEPALPPSTDSDDEWDDWDDDEPVITQTLTRKERKLLERQERERKKAEERAKKAMKKRGGVEQARPKGSRVNLSMMRTTTGRQLVKVAQAPRGSSAQASLETSAGSTLNVDLGGGVVEEGGRVIKAGDSLETLLEELEWVLLESDISAEATTAIIDSLRRALVGARLQTLLRAGYWDFDASVQRFIEEGDAPVVVMLVGVNGTGKTTTAAKLAQRLLNNGLSVIAAAGDTFRAGAIQQLESHCERLGIRCVSSQRGGDSAAIARDAIESAKAKGIDVVLVDTAGRMQNKTNLMNELNKVRKVTNPHLTLFVGDSLAGNDAVEQAKMFQDIMQFDGAVLTKMDTDAKGGAGLSIAFATGRPIVFAGVGQGYNDLLQFDPEWLLDQLFV